MDGRSEIYKINADAEKENTPIYFFARMVGEEHARILDVGCACGDNGGALKAARKSVLCGIELDSESARIAKETGVYEDVIVANIDNLESSDLEGFKEKFDYVLFGDVLEHLRDPLQAIRLFSSCLRSGGSVIASIPNVAHMSIKANLLVDDFTYTDVGLLDKTHIHLFTYRSIASLFASAGLLIEDAGFTMVPRNGWQKNDPWGVLSPAEKELILSDRHSYVCQYIVRASFSAAETSCIEVLNRAKLTLTEENTPKYIHSYREEMMAALDGVGKDMTIKAVSDLSYAYLQQLTEYRKNLAETNERLSELVAKSSQLEAEKDSLAALSRAQEVEHASLSERCAELEAEKTSLSNQNAVLAAECGDLRSQLSEVVSEKKNLCVVNKRYELAQDAVVGYLYGFQRGGSSRIVNIAKHVGLQLMKGGIGDKKDFLRWVVDGVRRKNLPDPRFNPFVDIYETVRNTFDLARAQPQSSEAASSAESTQEPPPSPSVRTLTPKRKTGLDRYDIIFLSVISYDFRYQRPQQIADYYAKAGHRVFYFNADFAVGETIQVRESHKNLFQVTLSFDAPSSVYAKDFASCQEQMKRQLKSLLKDYAIADAIVISEYPMWSDVVSFLRQGYAMCDVVDYLDDWDGFEDTATPELKSKTHTLLSNCGGIIASSQYLADKAKKYGKPVSLVRNGTEFAHFNRAFGAKKKSKRKTIGYYGAISHWFDFGKIEALARALPDVDIELIGAVTENVDKLKSFPNVRFLGEKKYQELPECIVDWDVCLIPFDTSTSLIQATNPVKFYEYLSAGKKVVATEIPEIAAFRDKYVYLANDNRCFVEAVKKCLNGFDTLATPEECAQFARDNDWQNRTRVISQEIEALLPKFSIVVLTYNQLAYTKACLESILRWTAYPNYELIVVDNDSQDGTADYLREFEKRDSRIKVILNGKNLGFAAGNNVGLRVATGKFLVLLNNDTIVSPGWLSRMAAHFERNPSCGALCPVTNSIGNEAEVPVCYTTSEEFLAEANERLFDEAFVSRKMKKAIAMYCFCVSRKAFESVGLISEAYGRGMFEDDDYCMALHAKGYLTDCIDDVLIHHFHSVSFNVIKSEEKQALFDHNRKIFEEKWKCEWKMHSYREGVTWNTNMKTQQAFDQILAGCITIFEN